MTQARRPIRLTADWVLPIAAPPIRDGAILIGPDGRIEAVGPGPAVPAPPDAWHHPYPNAAVLPGLVNAHTHLELTGLAGRVDQAEFSHWIRAVRELKAGLEPEWFVAAARRGVREAFAAGITFVYDTGDSGAIFAALTAEGGAGVGYQEAFGPHPDQVTQSMAALAEQIARAQGAAGPRVVVGVSPHAPYTVSAALYRAVAEWANARGLPMAVHLAESAAESAFVTEGGGPFGSAWRARAIPPLALQWPEPAARRSPVAWLDAHGVLGPTTLAIHTVQLDQADIDLLATRQVPIAHCPVSNRRHRHGDAPLAALRRSGLRVGVGTDSVISVDRLDLFAEMRAARHLAGLTAREALSMGTHDAARLLSSAPDFGTLEAGFWADLAVVDLGPPPPPRPDPEEGVLAAAPDRVVATYATGRVVYRAGPVT